MKLQNLLFVRSCVLDRAPAVGTKERTNAKNRSSFLYLIARLGIKIGYAQSMVVQTVKNTTISRTQIFIP